MSLSISKLEKLLINNGIFPDKFYRYHKYVIYIECTVVKSGLKFWLDIPSEYKFRIDSKSNVFDIKSIEIDDSDGEVVSEFAKKFNDLDVFNTYENTSNNVEDDFDKNNISSTLAENYKYTVKINDIDESDEKDIRDIKRQVERLRYSVMQTKYNICLTYKHYFAILNNDNVLVFTINNNDDLTKYRQLIVSVDLELFYNKIDKINTEIYKIKSSIDKILDMNYNKNISNINFMMEKSAIVITKFNELYNKKNHLIGLENKFENLFESANMSEKKILEKISVLQDIEGGKEHIDKLKNDIKDIENTKMEVLTNIVKTNEKKDNIALTLDKILFDNIVMLNSIVKNFELLLSMS